MILLVIFLFLIGIAGSFLHYLPSTTIVFLGIFFYGFKEGFSDITKNYLLILAVIVSFAVIFDNIAIKIKILKERVRVIVKIVVCIAMFISFVIKIL